MNDPALPVFDADTFIAWAMDRPEGEHWELVAGHPVAMAPERATHIRTKHRIARRLQDAVQRAGLPCEVFADGMSVQVDDGTVYEPDASMRCGQPLPGDAIKMTDPVIVVEVVSPSSRARDTGIKLADYFRIPSLRHYVIVRTDTDVLIHHSRNDGEDILTRVVHDGRLDFGDGLVLDEVFPPA